MDKSFDLSALLQNHEKKHKAKPTQFTSVAGGVRKRLEINITCRKSKRLTNFDNGRNLPQCGSPLKEPKPLTKEENRRLQLEKWREEKEKKKKEATAHKRKPFLTGVAHAPLTYVPPPPLPTAVPSTSGRVTRSQTAKNNSNKAKPVKNIVPPARTESFAPKNAVFKAPEMKNIAKPTLEPPTKIMKNKKKYTFDPVVPMTFSKSKCKTEPKRTENKRNVADKVPGQVERRPLRGQGRFKLVDSSSQSHSSGENLAPLSEQSKSKIKTSPKHVHSSSSEEKRSPVVERLKSRRKPSKKSIQCPEDPPPLDIKPPLLKTRTPRKSNELNKTSTPKNPVPKSESSSEERLRSPKSPGTALLTPEQIIEIDEIINNSPFVTRSRGKDKARKEIKKKIDDGLFEEDASDVDSVAHFRRQLDSEIKRMTEICETWEKIADQVALPETVQEAVQSAVGQARLLMSHKLQQFAGLVARCERPEPGRALVTPADLHGFWDMVFMQVVDVDVRFKKLEEMRAREWAEEAPVVTSKKVTVPRPKPRAKPAAASRLRDVIAAARKAKKQGVEPQETLEVGVEQSAEPKTFEAGFFSVRSPVRSPAATPRAARPSLLQAVLSSEANKSATKNRTSLAMLRASLIGKNVDDDSPLARPLVPLTPINLNATPGRSILKPVNTPSAKKSIKVVLFDDSGVETHDTGLDTECDNSVTGVEKLEESIVTGVSSMKIEKEKEQKENKPKKKSLVRQDAIQTSPIMTRSRRRSVATPVISTDVGEKTPHSSRRNKALQEVEVNTIEEKDHQKSSRRKTIGIVA